MDISKNPKKRRARGSGSVYRKGRVWWISYYGLEGRRHAESSGSPLKGVADRLLRSRVRDIERGVPATPQTGKLTFIEAAEALLQDYRHKGAALSMRPSDASLST